MKLRLLKEFFSEKRENGGLDVRLRFDELIRVTKAHFSYTKLELVAELGGYVGLFLGISVLHLTSAFENFIKVICESIEAKYLQKSPTPKHSVKDRVKLYSV